MTPEALRAYARVRSRLVTALRTACAQTNNERMAHRKLRTYYTRELRSLIAEIRAMDALCQEHAEAEHMRNFWMLCACGHCRECAHGLKACADIREGLTCRQRVGHDPHLP